jgi:hypothetical protein
VWVDAGTYVRIERAGMVFDGKDLDYANFESRKHRRWERAGDASERPLDSEETYLRIERRGSVLIASVSADGTHWTSFEPLSVDMPRRVQIGIACTHNTALPFEPRFEGFKLYQEASEGR